MINVMFFIVVLKSKVSWLKIPDRSGEKEKMQGSRRLGLEK